MVALVAPPDAMGSWMSLASTVQALVRTLSPPVLGPAFDVDATLPFWITGGTVALTLTCGALLVRHVPRPAATARVGDSSTRRRPETRANGADADAATNGSNGTSGSAVELELGEAVGWDGEAEQGRLSRRVEHEARDEMHALCDELTRLRGLKEAHESGEALLEERPPVQVRLRRPPSNLTSRGPAAVLPRLCEHRAAVIVLCA
jgi:hypothetical protein